MSDEASGMKDWLKKCLAATDNRGLTASAIVFFLFAFLYRSWVWFAVGIALLISSGARKRRPPPPSE